AGTYLVSSPFALSLTRLYLDGEEFDDLGFRALTCCRNLKLLSVSFCESATDLSLGYVKTLPKIEHLHLRKGREFTCEGFRKFFEYSETNGAEKDNEFPSRLKFLNLGECPAVNDVIVDLITTNCTGLQSLCLVWCWSVTEVGLGMIVQRLNDLRLLDIRGLDCIDGSAFLDVPDLYLTNLRYLGAEQCPRIEDSTLQILNLRKKDLIISNYHNYFITFTINNGDATFMERYDNEFHAAVNEQLSRIDGFCCLSDIR
ncbi:F-box/LRR-repeat protein 3, partial [Toxocara canis]